MSVRREPGAHYVVQRALLLMRLVVGVAVSVCAVGCATTQQPRGATSLETTPVSRLELEPIELRARREGSKTAIDVLDPLELFESAGRDLAAGRLRAAVERYERLLERFPSSRLTSPTLYNLGLAHEKARQFRRAASRYRELLRRFAGDRNAIDGAFRLGGCLAELQEWESSARVFARLLRRDDLSPGDQIEAYARQGLGHFRLEHYDQARKTLEAAARFHRRLDPFERLDDDFFVGLAFYYLAAIPHASFREIRPRDGAKLKEELDEKARLLLKAQAAYIETIRLKNPYWATAAGFQVGSLYREFYDVMMGVEPDFAEAAHDNARRSGVSAKRAKEQLKDAYFEELHQRIRPLLQKAIRVFEKNVVTAQRIGVNSPWVDKSRYQVAELKRLLTAPTREAAQRRSKSPAVPEDQPGQPARDPSALPGEKSTEDQPISSPARLEPQA